MIRLITFTDENMTIAADKLDKSAREHGADDVAIYTPENLDGHFMTSSLLPILEGSRGYSWWIWKPYIILGHMMVACKEGDILIYSDAGQEIKASLKAIVNAMDEDIMFFTNGFQHSHWCKKEVAKSINHQYSFDNAEFNSSYPSFKQVQASFIIFHVTDKVKEFVKEWYAWSLMPGMIDNTPRGDQFPEFREHRHDQAILTCLQIKYGYKLHWFPSTTNLHRSPPELGYYSEKFGVTIIHHRKRNNEY